LCTVASLLSRTSKKEDGMLDQPGITPDTTGQSAVRPVAGTTVYDSDGNKVGTVSQYDGWSNYFVVQRGLLMHKDVYVPMEAIAGRYEDGVRISVGKDDLRTLKWDQPPARGPEAGSPAAEAEEPTEASELNPHAMGGLGDMASHDASHDPASTSNPPTDDPHVNQQPMV
jgi:hypothetical protein